MHKTWTDPKGHIICILLNSVSEYTEHHKHVQIHRQMAINYNCLIYHTTIKFKLAPKISEITVIAAAAAATTTAMHFRNRISLKFKMKNSLVLANGMYNCICMCHVCIFLSASLFSYIRFRCFGWAIILSPLLPHDKIIECVAAFNFEIFFSLNSAIVWTKKNSSRDYVCSTCNRQIYKWISFFRFIKIFFSFLVCNNIRN